jgi:hypothetical protein
MEKTEEIEKTGITVSDGDLAIELTAESAAFMAVAFRLKPFGGVCEAPGGFCNYCPLRACSYDEAVAYMRDKMKK